MLTIELTFWNLICALQGNQSQSQSVNLFPHPSPSLWVFCKRVCMTCDACMLWYVYSVVVIAMVTSLLWLLFCHGPVRHHFDRHFHNLHASLTAGIWHLVTTVLHSKIRLSLPVNHIMDHHLRNGYQWYNDTFMYFLDLWRFMIIYEYLVIIILL